MSYIEKIIIQNFQNHHKLVLNLAKGLNVIYGNSDVGKSAIIRAIKWVVTNKPLGDAFRKHETDKTSVTIKKDGNLIRRRKSNKINEYKVNGENPHKAPRSSIPEDISSKLNLSQINIQSQHETFFLVHESPGQRSKILNEVAGLEIMDKTTGLANSEIREVNSSLKSKKKALTDTKVMIKDLSWVPKASSNLAELESMKKEIDVIFQKRKTLDILLTNMSCLEEERNKLFSIELVDDLDDLMDLSVELEKMSDNEEKITSLIKQVDSSKKKQSRLVDIDTTELENLLISINSMESKADRVQTAINSVISEKTKHMNVKKEILDTSKKITAMLKKFGICPLCNSKIK